MLDVILGGVTGLVGNVITAWSNYKTQKLKNEHAEKMYEYKIQELAAKTDSAIKITEAKVAGAVELADSRAYDTSQREGNKKAFGDTWIEKLFNVTGWMQYVAVPVALILAMLLGFVDFLKGLMRPGLTLYLTGVTSFLTWQAYDILQAAQATLTTDQAFDIYTKVTTIVIYLTVSCVTWWFGDRRIAKFLMRLDKSDAANQQVVNRPQGKITL